VHYKAFRLKVEPDAYTEEELEEMALGYTIKMRGIISYNRIKEIVKTGEPIPML